MSVRRGPADETVSTEYDDYDIQTVVMGLNFSTGGAAGTTVLEPAFTIEPLGGLARGEVAELVGLVENVATWGEDDGGSGAEHAEYAWEVSMDSVRHVTTGPGGDRGDEVQLTQDVNGRTAFDLLHADATDPDILRFGRIGGSVSVNLTNPYHSETVAYRDLYGKGPTFDRHDEINYHATAYKDADVGTSMNLTHKYIWDVSTEV